MKLGSINLKGFFWLYRPQISLIGGITAIAGSSVRGVTDLTSIIIAGIVFYCIHALAHPINDYFDRELDVYARPDAPIPSGLISPGQAKLISIVSVVIALITIMLIPLNLWFKILAILGLSTAIIFSTPPFQANKHPFFSYIVVGSGCAFAFLGGWTVSGEIAISSIPILLIIPIFMLNAGVKLLADILDVKSDRRTDRETLPMKIGVKNSFYIFTSSGTISILAYFLWSISLNLHYTTLIIGSIAAIIFFTGIYLFQRNYGNDLGREYLKIFMPTQMLIPLGIIIGHIIM